MKRILLSLLIIAGIGGAMVAGTRAFFSDTETSPNNTLAAGTIDISVDGQNPWTKTYLTTDLDDLKPGMNKTITFPVKNEGVNDLVLWKRINIKVRDEGLNTEPECLAEQGTWSGTNCTGGTRKTDVDSRIHYDMTLRLENMIPMAWNVMMSDIDQLWIPLGKIAPGETVQVTQVYKLDDLTGNEYQGDKLTFDIDLYAEQLKGPGPSHTTRGVVLDNKSLDSEGNYVYPIIDQTLGILTWDTAGTYSLRAFGLTGSQYQLARWDGTTQTMFGSTVIPSGGKVTSSGSYSFVSYTDAKYWLRDTSGSWPSASALWESNLVN
jgi:predicted ribosomally synthesized peptide with SipW-like signal peptide